MRIAKKLLAAMLTAVMVLGLFTGVRVKAAETGTPKISLKYVNSKTGVKITISKTSGADAYRVYLKGYGDSYADYWTDYAKNDWWREVALIEKNGKAKKVVVFTYKSKKNEKRKMGHRQPYTKVEISAINA